VQVPFEKAIEYKQYPSFISPYRKLFRIWLTPEFMTIEAQNLETNKDNKSFSDLNITPISFGHKAHELI